MTKFKIQFLPMGVTVEADTENLPKTRDGRRGSLLGHALNSHLEMDHACGGVCACSTCHVVVKEGSKSLSPAEEEEEDMLDLAPGLTLQSRLACQAVPDGSADLVVEIPSWNRNRISEGDEE
jgi:2Fe-2S ferredoxin